MIVLIVDDTAQERKLLRLLFQVKGWEVVEAVNGDEGLAVARRHLPDLIVSDALMPKKDGFELLWELRHSKLADTPFIIFTATYRGEADRAFCLDIGVDAYVEKPLRPDDFWRLVTDVLEKRKRGEKPVVKVDEDGFLKGYHDVLVRKLREKL